MRPRFQKKYTSAHHGEPIEDGRPTCPLCKLSLYNISNLSSHLKSQHGKRGASVKLPPAVRAEKKKQRVKEGSKKQTILRRKKREEKRNSRPHRKTQTLAKIKRDVLSVMASWDIPSAQERGVFKSNVPERAHVYYAKSKIPGAGMGVFANRDVQTGEVLTIFEGTTVTKRPKSFEDRQYTVITGSVKNPTYLVGLKTPQVNKGLGSFVNRGAHHGVHQNNCEINMEHDKNTVVVASTRDMVKDTELLICYGTSGFRLT